MHFIAAYIYFVQKLSYNIAKIACANFEEVIVCIKSQNTRLTSHYLVIAE